MHFPSSPWVTKRWGPCFLSRVCSLGHQRWAQSALDFVHTGVQGAWSHLPNPADASICGLGADLKPAPTPRDSSTPP